MAKFTFIFVLIFTIQINAQILNMPEVIQEKDQWCWAGVTKSILNYYSFELEQCEIADYARTQITWHDFGDTDCCVNPNLGCNYWNYAYGSDGSMEDILEHFGEINNYGISNDLSLVQITNNLTANRPFIARWGWDAGGGHFVIGHGKSGNNIYYMDPWFGEGLHITTYDWLQNGGSHTWTHTNVITTSATATIYDESMMALAIYPNPVTTNFSIESKHSINNIELYNEIGQLVLRTNSYQYIDVTLFNKGVYFLKILFNNTTVNKKIIIQ